MPLTYPYSRGNKLGRDRPLYHSTRSTTEMEKAIRENNFGAFMIQCTLAGITWNWIIGDSSLAYIFFNKASRIIAGILRRGKIEKKKPPVENILTDVFSNFLQCRMDFQRFELIVTAAAESYPNALDIVKNVLNNIKFNDRIYEDVDFVGGNFLYVDKTIELFNRLFPNENLVPSRRGTWTDDRDGEVYDTARLMNLEWISVPLKYGMDEDGKITLGDFQKNCKKIIPNGWRLPTEKDAEKIWPVTCSYCSFSTAAVVDKDSGWNISPADFGMLQISKEEELGSSGLKIKPTHVGASRLSTLCSFFVQGEKVPEQRCLRLCDDGPVKTDVIRKDFRNTIDTALMFYKSCVLLCRDVNREK